MCRLRVLEIYVYLRFASFYDFDILSFLMGSLCISLTSPATLERLEFNITFRDSIPYFPSFYEDLREAGVWSHLDSITTLPTGSRLQRVDINIHYNYLLINNAEVPDDHEVLKAVLDALPSLRMKDILFIKVDTLCSSARYVSGNTGSTEYCDGTT